MVSQNKQCFLKKWATECCSQTSWILVALRRVAGGRTHLFFVHPLPTKASPHPVLGLCLPLHLSESLVHLQQTFCHHDKPLRRVGLRRAERHPKHLRVGLRDALHSAGGGAAGRAAGRAAGPLQAHPRAADGTGCSREDLPGRAGRRADGGVSAEGERWRWVGGGRGDKICTVFGPDDGKLWERRYSKLSVILRPCNNLFCAWKHCLMWKRKCNVSCTSCLVFFRLLIKQAEVFVFDFSPQTTIFSKYI